MIKYFAGALCFAGALTATAASAKTGDPLPLGDGLTLDPIVDLRVRYESVDQPLVDAEAITARLRAGFELRNTSGVSVLVEGEGTWAIGEDYNAFPFAIASRQRRPGFATVADPENLELNRLQLQWKSKAATVTLGRQRINLDDQRWVGNVGWRQNEQTFDAIRGEAKAGPVSLDAAYMIGQRTVFGALAGPREAYKGDFVLLGAGGKIGPVQAKAFAYLLDYDTPFFLTNSSQTYGLRLTAPVPLGKAKLTLAASYARQSNYRLNPVIYRADYIAGEAAVAFRGLTVTGGWEQLGSDTGRFAVQAPMGTLHKFDGWADLFLTTPAAGLQDAYAGAAYKFGGVKALPGLNAAVTYHQFDSDTGNIAYGSEWDASLGFKLDRFALLAKYADYQRAAFGTDTRKFWLQAETSF
ncbi:MAG: alginate export family protein [Croceibacterium sp.]